MIRSPRFAAALLLAGFAGAAVPAAAADALPCAEYISSGGDDAPAMGQLQGTETRTETISYTIQASPGGVGSTTTVTETTTYEIGHYDMGNGEILEMDCRTYEPILD